MNFNKAITVSAARLNFLYNLQKELPGVTGYLAERCVNCRYKDICRPGFDCPYESVFNGARVR